MRGTGFRYDFHWKLLLIWALYAGCSTLACKLYQCPQSTNLAINSLKVSIVLLKPIDSPYQYDKHFNSGRHSETHNEPFECSDYQLGCQLSDGNSFYEKTSYCCYVCLERKV